METFQTKFIKSLWIKFIDTLTILYIVNYKDHKWIQKISTKTKNTKNFKKTIKISLKNKLIIILMALLYPSNLEFIYQWIQVISKGAKMPINLKLIKMHSQTKAKHRTVANKSNKILLINLNKLLNLNKSFNKPNFKLDLDLIPS